MQLLSAERVVDVAYISSQEDDNPQHHQDWALLLQTPHRWMEQKITIPFLKVMIDASDVKMSSDVHIMD